MRGDPGRVGVAPEWRLVEVAHVAQGEGDRQPGGRPGADEDRLLPPQRGADELAEDPVAVSPRGADPPPGPASILGLDREPSRGNVRRAAPDPDAAPAAEGDEREAERFQYQLRLVLGGGLAAKVEPGLHRLVVRTAAAVVVADLVPEEVGDAGGPGPVHRLGGPAGEDLRREAAGIGRP